MKQNTNEVRSYAMQFDLIVEVGDTVSISTFQEGH